MAMKKSELRELYLMMFPEYPDIVNITQLQSMLGISRHLAYDLINDGYIRGLKIGNAFRIPKVNVITLGIILASSTVHYKRMILPLFVSINLVLIGFYYLRSASSNNYFPFSVSLAAFSADIVFILQGLHNSLYTSD